jgi:hypothetical protein
MKPTELDTKITVPTEEEQEQVVGGAAAYRARLTAPLSETNVAIPARWDPHPPILTPVITKI